MPFGRHLNCFANPKELMSFGKNEEVQYEKYGENSYQRIAAVTAVVDVGNVPIKTAKAFIENTYV